MIWLVIAYVAGVVVWAAVCLFSMGSGTYDLRHPKQRSEWGGVIHVDLDEARQEILTGWRFLPMAPIWPLVSVFYGVRALVRQVTRLYRWVIGQVLPVVVEAKNQEPQDKR